MLKKIIARVAVLFLVFVAGVILFTSMRNTEGSAEAVELEENTLPVLYIQEGERRINPMFGNKTQIKGVSVREHITLLSTGRDLTIAMDTKGQSVQSVICTVRELSGGEIVENAAVKNFSEDNGFQKADIHLDTPILMGQEYLLELTVQTENGQTWYYYTRILQRSGVGLTDYLAFVENFDEKCMDKEGVKELAQSIETSRANDNTSFSRVDIHSNLDQLSWGSLAPKLLQSPQIRVKEMNETTVSIQTAYVLAAVNPEGAAEYYTVTEFFRMRKSSDRVILLNFERSLTSFFDAELPVLTSKGINLGITAEDTHFVADSSGNVVAFVVNKELWTYNRSAGKCTKLFSLRRNAKKLADERYSYGAYDIRIVSVSESGDVTYVVYGYMNCGKYTGETGVAVYQFSAERQISEEKLFIPSETSYELLQQYLGRLLYVNAQGNLYLYMNDSLYRFDPETGSCAAIQSAIVPDSFVAAENQAGAAWMTREDTAEENRLTVIDLDTEERLEIRAADGQRLKALGFINDDFVYGAASEADILTDAAGNRTFAMQILRIVSMAGELKKEYRQDGIYIRDVVISEGLLEMNRLVRTENGYAETTQDHIMNGEQQANEIVTSRMALMDDRRKTQKLLEFPTEGRSTALLATEGRFYERGVRAQQTLTFAAESGQPLYFVYAKGVLQSLCTTPTEAIRAADAQVGVVLDAQQTYVWERGNRPTITKLDPAAFPEAIKNASLNEQELQASLGEGQKVLNLTGCALDSIFYMVGKGHPVVAKLNWNNMENVVIVGYDQFKNTWVYDPLTQTVLPLGQSDSTNAFLAQGNVFLSYM